MKWTSKEPKIDGWYWFRNKYGHKFIYYVQKGRAYYGTDLLREDDEKHEWLGPIPEP